MPKDLMDINISLFILFKSPSISFGTEAGGGFCYQVPFKTGEFIFLFTIRPSSIPNLVRQ